MIMNIFKDIHREKRKTILVITHNPEVAKMTQRIITIKDGMITGDVSNTPVA